jgi:periplasmic protein TonB
MFEKLIESNPEVRPEKTILSLTISAFLHACILVVAIITPLFFTETLNPQQLVTYLVAPPPPPPPPPPPLAVVSKAVKISKVIPQDSAHLTVPVTIPKVVARIVDEGPPPEISANGGVVGGVPGGVPGGTIGGVLGGVLGGMPAAVAPPPPPPPPKAEPPKVKAPVRVGGKVRSPHILRRIEPVYPSLAKAARIQGKVVLEAQLTEQGRVADLKFVSGHPLLIDSAMASARQWVYEPTYLNDVPYPVILYITVNFVLQ